jgi:hypothetical protein
MKTSKSRRGRGKARRNRECGSKKPMTQQQARATAIALVRKQGARMNAYRCGFCYLPSGAAAWHVGHRQRLGNRLG